MKDIDTTLNGFVKSKPGLNFEGKQGIEISFRQTESHPSTTTMGLTRQAAGLLYLQLKDLLHQQ